MPLRRLLALAVLAITATGPAPAAAAPARAAAASAAPAVVVRLAPDVVVQREEMTLADLAAVEGDEPLASRLRALKLGTAPAAGLSHRFDAEGLRYRFRALGLDATKVELVVPERVVVTRAFQVVPGAALVEAVKGQALARLEGRADGAVSGPVSLVPVARPEDLRVPTGEVAIDARLQEGPVGSSFLSAIVTVRVNGRDHHAIPMTFRLGRYQQVVVAVRALDPKAALGPADFRVEARPSTEIPPDALTELANPVDWEAVRPVKAGEVISAHTLHQKILVRRGDLVTLFLEGSGFRITTQGQAREDARRGDTVRVMNVASKREVLGKVEGSGVVRVPFGR